MFDEELRERILGAGALRPPPILPAGTADRQSADWRWIGDRQRHRDLAVVLFAELTTVLRATPTKCRPFFGKPVSSMIQASIGPCRSTAGPASSRTLSSIASSDHGELPTKCRSD